MDSSNQQSDQDRASRLRIVPLHERLRLEALERFLGASGISRSVLLHRRAWLAAVLVQIGYYLGALLGMALTLQPHAISVLWPANIVLLAGLLLSPKRLWGFLILAAFPAHLLVEVPQGVPYPMALCWFISNCFEAFIGAAAIRFLLPTPMKFESLQSAWIFFACAGFLGPFVSSFLDAAFVVLNAFGSEPYWEIWRMRFVCNAMTAVIVGPVIVALGSLHWKAFRESGARRLTEGLVLAVGLTAVSLLVFCDAASPKWITPILVYAPLPFLLWAAVRFGPATSSVSVLGVALLVIWGAVHRLGPFSSSVPEESAFSMQLFFIVISVTLMSLAVVLKERRRIQRALQHSEERYREVVDSHTDLICRYALDTTLTFVNEPYCRFFGLQRESLLGRKFLDLVPVSAREPFLDKIQKMRAEGIPAILEHEVCRPDGTTGWHLWTDHPVFGNDGQIVEFQGVGRDVTERKRAEQARQELAHASRLVLAGELTAMVAHEINQPLGAILSNAETGEMLLQSPDPNLEEVREILADIRKDNRRASEAIRRIRDLLRKREMEMLPVNVNEVVADVLHLVSGDALLRRVHIERRLAPGALFVAGDKVHLQQVLLNLVLNGMDAMASMPENRRLAVCTGIADGGRIEITVADNGPGIPVDKLGRLFDLFFTTKTDGMGIGLAIARAIIDAHSGDIQAQNAPHGGAIFRCEFPSWSENQTLVSGY